MCIPLSLFDLSLASEGKMSYYNSIVSPVNDHVIRLSVMIAPFYWHYHPNSDESFLVSAGILCIDLEDRVIELGPGQGITIPAGMKHRTRPKGDRSVNITFERADMVTVECNCQ